MDRASQVLAQGVEPGVEPGRPPVKKKLALTFNGHAAQRAILPWRLRDAEGKPARQKRLRILALNFEAVQSAVIS
jgi:hypothetical protein